MMRRIISIFLAIIITVAIPSCYSIEKTEDSVSETEITELGEFADGVFEINVGYFTLKFPTKWEDAITAIIEESTVSFVHNMSGINVFTIMIGDNSRGNLLGILDTGDDKISVSMIEEKLDTSDEYYIELHDIREDMNVIVNHLCNDYDFVVSETANRNGTTEQSVQHHGDTGSDYYSEKIVEVKVVAPVQPVDIVHKGILSFMSCTPNIFAPDEFKEYRVDGSIDVSIPIEISYSTDAVDIKAATIEIFERDKSINTSRFFVFDSSRKISICNLKAGTIYDYVVTVVTKKGEYGVSEGSISTTESPRFLTVDGIHNVRDVGGWKTLDGRRIKQGVLYRGTELDGAVEDSYKLTTAGIDTMRTLLGIKYDMDLRNPDATGNPMGFLGADIPHKYYNSAMYGQAFSDQGKEKICEVFADLAEPNNYPMYMHCTYGIDRTGTICYLLEALLGVSDEDLIREYGLSGARSDSVNKSNLTVFVTKLKEYQGNTTQERVENYLISTGLTPSQLDAIKSIYLEEVA